MPLIKIQHIVSVSSEDKNYEAENLLLEGEYKKWKCAPGGQKQVSVVLQFEKASKIRSIDIGNEGSAFIEVLVGRMSDNEQNYQVLLIASSFMTPLESRNGTNQNRVRMFGADKFTKGVADEKWDRAKIVCTQPFNKTASYGIAFIKFHSYDSPHEPSSSSTEASTQIGAFKLKDESDDASVLKPGALFLKRKDTKDSTKDILEIRAASLKAEADILSTPEKPIKDLEAVKRKLQSDDKIESERKKLNVSRKESNLPSVSNSNEANPSVVRKRSISPTTKANITKEPVKQTKVSLASNLSKPTVSKSDKEENTSVPFHKLMSGVTFALSGFQNPLRSELREKGLDMGAKYRPDWDDSCTHLVCAFPNTPKYQQVKHDSGKIVSKAWLIDCHKRKVLLPWKKYKLKSSNDDTDSGTDDDVKGNTKKPGAASSTKTESPTTSKVIEKEASPDNDNNRNKKDGNDVIVGDDDDDYGGSTDVDSLPSDDKSHIVNDCSSTEYDTDEEIRRAMEKDGNLSPLPDTSNMPLPDLPDYFHGSKFLLYSDFDPDEKRTLMRLIVAFNGKIEDYMNDSIAYVVTKADWDDNFDEALAANGGIVFVKPKWIYMCAQKQKVIPHQPYIIVPQN